MAAPILLALLCTSQLPCPTTAGSQPFGTAAATAGAPPTVELAGALVPGEAFALRVTSGTPSSIGVLVLGPTEVALPLPAFAATLYVGAPYLLAAFATDAAGASPALFAADPLAANLCGAGVVAQAAVVDGAAPGGWHVGAGRRLTVGAPGPAEGLFDHPQLAGLTDARGLAVGDIDVDGALDLVVGRTFQASATVFLGAGDGTFAPGVDLPTASAIDGPLLVDLDGDGALDLVYAAVAAVGVSWGLGDGGFQPFVLLDDGGQGLGSVGDALAFADLDGDGRLDLVAPRSSTDDLLVLRQTAPRSFAAPTATAVGNAPQDVVSGDLDGDGVADLLVAHGLFFSSGVWFGDGLRWLRGVGDGSFAAPVPLVPDVGLGDLTLVDADGDGALDLLAVSTAGLLWYARGNGDGTFGAPLETPTGGASGPFVFADLDGDGRLDAAGTSFASFEHPRMHVVLDVTGSPSAASVVPTALATAWLAAGDVTGDGAPDLIGCLDEVGVWTGDGAGGFPPLEVALPAGSTPSLDALVDFDGDGRPDVVGRWNVDSGQGLPDSFLAVARGQADGGFAPAELTPSPMYTGPGISGLVVAEFDGDGVLDVAVSGSGGTQVVPGDGGGGFGAAYASLSMSAAELRAADLDGDGRLDLIGNQLFADSVQLARGGGDGSLSPLPAISNQLDYYRFDLGDLDGDGDLDLVYTRKVDSGKVTTYLGNGDGTFFQKANTPVAALPGQPRIADLDLDGRRDLVLSVAGTLQRWPGLGNGWFGPAEPLGFDQAGSGLAVADMNTDGLADLVVNTGYAGFSRAVVVLPGIGSGGFGPPAQYGSGQSSADFEVRDLDGDGAPEIVYGFAGLTVLRNRLLAP